MQLSINITCDNAAFGETEHERSAEICRILRKVESMINAGFTGGIARDINGNPVGTFKFSEDSPHAIV